MEVEKQLRQPATMTSTLATYFSTMTEHADQMEVLSPVRMEVACNWDKVKKCCSIDYGSKTKCYIFYMLNINNYTDGEISLS
jgi:hypothetical protein